MPRAKGRVRPRVVEAVSLVDGDHVAEVSWKTTGRSAVNVLMRSIIRTPSAHPSHKPTAAYRHVTFLRGCYRVCAR